MPPNIENFFMKDGMLTGEAAAVLIGLCLGCVGLFGAIRSLRGKPRPTSGLRKLKPLV